MATPGGGARVSLHPSALRCDRCPCAPSPLAGAPLGTTVLAPVGRCDLGVGLGLATSAAVAERLLLLSRRRRRGSLVRCRRHCVLGGAATLPGATLPALALVAALALARAQGSKRRHAADKMRWLLRLSLAGATCARPRPSRRGGRRREAKAAVRPTAKAPMPAPRRRRGYASSRRMRPPIRLRRGCHPQVHLSSRRNEAMHSTTAEGQCDVLCVAPAREEKHAVQAARGPLMLRAAAVHGPWTSIPLSVSAAASLPGPADGALAIHAARCSALLAAPAAGSHRGERHADGVARATRGRRAAAGMTAVAVTAA